MIPSVFYQSFVSNHYYLALEQDLQNQI